MDSSLLQILLISRKVKRRKWERRAKTPERREMTQLVQPRKRSMLLPLLLFNPSPLKQPNAVSAGIVNSMTIILFSKSANAEVEWNSSTLNALRAG
jgi:hypothetical protein